MSEGEATARLELADALRLADPDDRALLKDMYMHHHPCGGWAPENDQKWALLQKLARRRWAELGATAWTMTVTAAGGDDE